MSRVKGFLSKFKIKSLYIKWLLLFTGLIISSQLLTFAIVSQFIIPDFVENVSNKMYKKAELTQSLYKQGVVLTEEALMSLGTIDTKMIPINKDDVPEDIGRFSHIITLDMIQRASRGEIVTQYDSDKSFRMPFCLVGLGDSIVLLTPNIEGNELNSFIRGIKDSLLIGAVLGSGFIVIALIVVIRPIKRVTAAAREVAKGNFNVKLETKSVDEVGQLIENFNRMTEELQKNEYLKKDFVSSVSHEFKTPITSIEGFTLLLKNKELTPEQFEEYTDIIIKETGRLSNLSSNLLKLSILDNSGFEPTKSEFYLDEQIRNVILLLENQWEEKQIELEIEMSEVLFYGNEELLSQVWINLIQNAINFSPIGGLITITLKEENKNAFVTVADKGIGISPKHKDKIFSRFYKADKSRSKEGSGLGLSIVKRIVELSKGNVSFTSKEGEGTMFIVMLPNGTKIQL